MVFFVYSDESSKYLDKILVDGQTELSRLNQTRAFFFALDRLVTLLRAKINSGRADTTFDDVHADRKVADLLRVYLVVKFSKQKLCFV